MALPPMNPDKTAAGIVVDPKTLERVVPTSARKDGSMRKELKIRPGFTPQEDVGRFRGSRQRAQDQAGPPKIPGSDRTRSPPSTGENPFVSSPSNSSSTKTKAQLKNEKRRANKKAGPPKNWDESDDEEDDGAIGDAFEAGDEARKSQGQGDQTKTKTSTEEAKREEPAWPVEDGGQGMVGEEGPGMDGDGGIPEDPIPVEPKPEMQDKEDGQGEGTTAILSPPPPGPSAKDPAAPSAPPPSNEPEWRTASNRRRPQQTQQKPHPIQGGRKGPIGLAHPPPIESSTSKPRGGGPGRGQNRQRRPQASREQSQSQSQSQPQSQTQSSKISTQEEKKEPRVRKEVKVRETGLGSLADRVKGLVISTQDDGKKKKDKAAGADPSA